jgi:hypothetical protein
VIHFGRPFVAGWDPARVPWWQDPGYRTPWSFLRFGRAAIDPVYAGLNGFWDSLYSTVWADGFLSGIAMSQYRPPWNYKLMSALALLSLVPTCSLIAGLLKASRDKCLCFAAVCLAVFLLALADLYLTLPIYSTAKGTYMLGLTPCIAILVAAGADTLKSRPWKRATLYALLVAWAAAAYGAFTILPV